MPQRTPTRRRYLAAVAALGAAALSGCAAEEPTTAPDGDPTDDPAEGPAGDSTDAPAGTGTAGATAIHAGYETTEVTVETPDGEVLGRVTAAIADTPELRYLGLSDTESLPEDRGMLFVYDEVGEHTYVMREMDFGLDIVYADDEGVITTIHHAPAPGPGEDGESQTYPGRGQYVLEVNRGWTTDRGVEAGDVLDFDL